MRTFIIDGEQCEGTEFLRQLEDAIRENVEAHYDDLLDMSYREVKIGHCTFTASQILKNCDPTAYRCGINDYVDADFEDAQNELERGRAYEAEGRIFRIIEEEDE